MNDLNKVTHIFLVAVLNNSTYYAYGGSATQLPVQNLDTLDAFHLDEWTTEPNFAYWITAKMLIPVKGDGALLAAQ